MLWEYLNASSRIQHEGKVDFTKELFDVPVSVPVHSKQLVEATEFTPEIRGQIYNVEKILCYLGRFFFLKM